MITRPDDDSGFRVHRVSFSGAAGAFVGAGAIAILLLGVPVLRWPLFLAAVIGVMCGVGLYFHRRRT